MVLRTSLPTRAISETARGPRRSPGRFPRTALTRPKPAVDNSEGEAATGRFACTPRESTTRHPPSYEPSACRASVTRATGARVQRGFCRPARRRLVGPRGQTDGLERRAVSAQTEGTDRGGTHRAGQRGPNRGTVRPAGSESGVAHQNIGARARHSSRRLATPTYTSQ